MKSDLPKRFREGDELTASLINDILEELWRWRKMEGMPPVYVSDADSDVPPLIFSKPYVDIMWGDTQGGFTAATGSPPVPTSQDVKFYNITTSSPPVLTLQSETTKAWNPYTHTGGIAANTLALFGQTSDGTWWIITADC